MILLALTARAESARRDHEGRAWLAWHIAALTGADPKKFPKSPAALIPKRASTTAPMDWKAMERASLAWVVNQAAGGR